MRTTKPKIVVICWKIRIFAYWTTPILNVTYRRICCDLLKNSYLCLLNNTAVLYAGLDFVLWFAEKFVSLLIEQHLFTKELYLRICCDLLKNSYLCLLNNTLFRLRITVITVVICWKIRIFAYWTTPMIQIATIKKQLWFAEKFVSLLIEQHQV